jgi:hypothetical protein
LTNPTINTDNLIPLIAGCAGTIHWIDSLAKRIDLQALTQLTNEVTDIAFCTDIPIKCLAIHIRWCADYAINTIDHIALEAGET